MMTLTYSA